MIIQKVSIWYLSHTVDDTADIYDFSFTDNIEDYSNGITVVTPIMMQKIRYYSYTDNIEEDCKKWWHCSHTDDNWESKINDSYIANF